MKHAVRINIWDVVDGYDVKEAADNFIHGMHSDPQWIRVNAIDLTVEEAPPITFKVSDFDCVDVFADGAPAGRLSLSDLGRWSLAGDLAEVLPDAIISNDLHTMMVAVSTAVERGFDERTLTFDWEDHQIRRAA